MICNDTVELVWNVRYIDNHGATTIVKITIAQIL